MISAWIQYKGNSETWWLSSALDICLQLLVALSYPVGEKCSFQLRDVGKRQCGSFFNVKPAPLLSTNFLPSALISLRPNAHVCNLFHLRREQSFVFHQTLKQIICTSWATLGKFLSQHQSPPLKNWEKLSFKEYKDDIQNHEYESVCHS